MNGVVINEWLPNPTGNDTAGEFVELFNAGDTRVDLRGWSIVPKGVKKRVKLSGVIPAQGYIVLKRTDTKLVLKNSDEGLALYDSHGALADQSEFIGIAPEGKSFSRIANTSPSPYSANASQGKQGRIIYQPENFAWGKPTPGAPNNIVASVATGFEWPLGIPIHQSAIGASSMIGAMLFVAVLLTSAILYSIRVNEDLSDIFFSRDEIAG